MAVEHVDVLVVGAGLSGTGMGTAMITGAAAQAVRADRALARRTTG